MFTPTKEQIKIVETVKTGKNILVAAFAGTGKTSTLSLIATQYPQKRFLYLAYNKQMEKEARRKFGFNVTSCTIHSLAYQKLGHKYQSKLQLKLYTNKVSSFFEVKGFARHENGHNCYATPNSIAACAKETVLRFCLSADATLLPHHINTRHLEKYQEKYQLIHYDLAHLKRPRNFLEQYLATTFVLAKKLWLEMTNIDNQEIGIEHDGYLKLWQLSKPQVIDFDCIMLDEAQDANAPILDILNNQQCQRIYVGDANQQIYAWRGSINAMQKLKGTKLYLTQSFRFGEKVAAIANLVLQKLGETKVLKGNPTLPTTIGRIDETKPYTVICRTNATLFEHGLIFAERKKKIHIVGGLAQPSTLLLSAYYLWLGDLTQVKVPHIQHFHTWSRLAEEAQMTRDNELAHLVNFILKYQNDTPKVLETIKEAANYPESQADVVLVTGHKAKGCEWDQVIVNEDFPPLSKAKGEELNLLYVSVTRAMSILDLLMNNAPAHWLDKPLDNVKAESTEGKSIKTPCSQSVPGSETTSLLQRIKELFLV